MLKCQLMQFDLVSLCTLCCTVQCAFLSVVAMFWILGILHHRMCFMIIALDELWRLFTSPSLRSFEWNEHTVSSSQRLVVADCVFCDQGCREKSEEQRWSEWGQSFRRSVSKFSTTTDVMLSPHKTSYMALNYLSEVVMRSGAFYRCFPRCVWTKRRRCLTSSNGFSSTQNTI